MKKKICFVVTLSATYRSFLLELSRYLIKYHDYDVTVITDNDDSMYELTNENLHYIPVKMKRGLSLDGFLATWRLYKIFKREKFDIVQYSTRNAGTYASVAAWMAGVKCRLYCQWGMMFIALKGFKRFLLWLDEKIITRLSTVIESESFSMFETAIEHNIYPREKASVIWNGSACGVNLSKYQLPMKAQWREEVREKYGIPTSACVFGYCGRITRDKGMNELFKSFREVLKERNAYLMIIGAYDNPETIDQEVFDWAKKCPNVIFTGRQNQVSKYYSALDVFMSLSYREGFGLVVIEAAAMAVPGIVSDALGQRDTIVNGETGLLVKTKDTDSVVKAMNFCIEHPEEVLEMGQKTRSDVQTKYDQETLFQILAEHRNELIEQN